ncbi:predicted protein [Naegleria gruberi]|uniref:Predicted protein n=1 Tax=Naegleria gruberi TaxID=5762 RepID=D2VKT2_NAEGR|nr:uncharacterized protein NAEGRDRAFT_69503 [Naegleria gruberi]EFC42651.1 predicted protein [Naegleria gruberi]|eukprot:XP_002675395.1 predicted protein [Naegleria gruberi strain NEG-M]
MPPNNKVRPVSSNTTTTTASESKSTKASSPPSTSASVNNQQNSLNNTVASNADTSSSYTTTTRSNYDNMSDSGDETGIKVVVRMRPFNDREMKLKAQPCITITKANREVLIKRKDKEDKKFYFDDVFDENSTQQEVYSSTGQRVLDRYVLGFNACIFAYGQTGSGKSWTMQGMKGNQEKEGIMSRFVRELFGYVEREKEKTDITIKASYLEIYNENILDLLNPHSGRVSYEIREDKVKGTYITNLIEKPITTDTELNEILDEGATRRTVGETKMNQESSRSHGILQICMEQVDKGDEDGFSYRSNKISLVDLAGSERQSATEATGDRLKEGAKINLSLSNLGNVINALVKKTNFVPYRNSKLTRLLKDSIGGNSYTLLVVCVSPADVNAEESLSTLYFADRAKQIKNKLKVSRGDPRLEKIAELLEIEKQLRARVLELETELSKYTTVPPPVQKSLATSSTAVGESISASQFAKIKNDMKGESKIVQTDPVQFADGKTYEPLDIENPQQPPKKQGCCCIQ